MSTGAVYVVNLDEIANSTINANVDLSSAESLINDVLNEVKKPSGAQQAKGLYLDVPAISGEYTLTYTPTTDILLTAVVYSQSAYKSGDNWDLNVNGLPIFQSLFTKELPERKQFSKYYPVPAGNTIEIILHNTSGNSRQVYADIEYIGVI